MITPLRLRQAAILADCASFRRAAAALHISQPALSKSIQALERALGVKLFERRRDAVTPTEFGRLVLAHSRDMALAESELLRQLKLLAGLETGSLFIAAGPLPGAMSVYPAVGALLAKHPNLEISIRSAGWREVVQAVADKKVDLGICELSGASFDDSLQTDLVGQHRLHLLCRAGHPILGERRIALTQLLQYPWAATRIPRRIAARFPPATGRAGHIDVSNGDFVPAVDVWAPSGLGRVVAKSDVLSLSTLSLFEPELTSGSVVIVPTEGLDFRAGYGFVLLKSRPLSPAANACMAEIRAHEKSLARDEARLYGLYQHAQRPARA